MAVYLPELRIMMRDWITSETETPADPGVNTAQKILSLQAAIEKVIRGKSETVKLALVALLAK